MLKYIAKLQLRANEDRGATAVEYGLMVAAIAAVIVVTVLALGVKVESAFTKVLNALPA